jgi:hypothetical protein
MVGGGDVRRAQAAERFQHARPDSRWQRRRGANEIRVLVCLIRGDGRGDVKRVLNRSIAPRVSGSSPGRGPQPTLRDPGGVAARAARVELREDSEDPDQRILGQILCRVPVDLARKELGEHGPQPSQQRIDRTGFALLCHPHGWLELCIVRPGLNAVS